MKINRQVFFMSVVAFDPEDKTGVNNHWLYDRAPDMKLFQLHSAEISIGDAGTGNEGIVAVHDGHEYTHWNLWPGVESRELIGRIEFRGTHTNFLLPLNGWECKEYTIGIRSTSEANGFKICAIIWYFLKTATREELLEYAIKHPIREDTFKRAMRGTTVEATEET